MSMIPNGNDVYTKRVGRRLQVKVPYNPLFLPHAHKLEGRWRKRSGIWSFHAGRFAEVAKVLNDLYGTAIKIKTEAPGD